METSKGIISTIVIICIFIFTIGIIGIYILFPFSINKFSFQQKDIQNNKAISSYSFPKTTVIYEKDLTTIALFDINSKKETVIDIKDKIIISSPVERAIKPEFLWSRKNNFLAVLVGKTEEYSTVSYITRDLYLINPKTNRLELIIQNAPDAIEWSFEEDGFYGDEMYDEQGYRITSGSLSVNGIRVIAKTEYYFVGLNGVKRRVTEDAYQENRGKKRDIYLKQSSTQ